MQDANEEARVRARLRRAHDLPEEAPSAIWLVSAIIEDALLHRASDIHIDPQHAALSVRLRIDGELSSAYSLPRGFHEELVARCKILAGLRIDERSAGQDGRFAFASARFGAVDVRISLLPCYFGQNAVLRLLAGALHTASLAELGMSDGQSACVLAHLDRPHGLILVSGPTGSGKTTTLYALMRRLQERPRSLISVEDPVEYVVESIRQVEIRAREGFGFATALRSVLRQDPDVIMVGEIRDEETARLALQSALTGHLVLASIHGKDCFGTLVRLRDLGIEPYLIAETVSLVVSQRLVRGRCALCRGVQLEKLDCACGGSGHAGRIGAFELLEGTSELAHAIRNGSEAAYAHA